jgi:Domain of unknown function (DUF4189)
MVVRILGRIFFAVLVFYGFTLAAETAAQAAGAIAIGHCDRYGYSYGAASVGTARRRALAQCEGNGDNCQVVVTLRYMCGAFAVSGDGGCGARGWAYAKTRGAAERLAIGSCYKYGGRDCRAQAWVCDAGP